MGEQGPLWVALWGAGKRGPMDSGLQLVCAVHAFGLNPLYFSMSFPALLSYLPFLVWLQFVLKTGNIHSIHWGWKEGQEEGWSAQGRC